MARMKKRDRQKDRVLILKPTVMLMILNEFQKSIL